MSNKDSVWDPNSTSGRSKPTVEQNNNANLVAARTTRDGKPDTSYMSPTEREAWDNMVIRSSSRQTNDAERGAFAGALGTPGIFRDTTNPLDDVIGAMPTSLRGLTQDTLDDISNVGKGIGKLANGILGGSSKSGKVVDGSRVIPLGGKANTPVKGGKTGSTDLVKMAKPIFTKGAKSEGKTVDAYENTSINSPQNKLTSVLDGVLGAFNNGIKGLLGKALGDASKIAGITANVTDPNRAATVLDSFKNNLLNGVPLTKDSISQTINQAAGFNTNALNFNDGFKGFTKSIMDDMVKSVDGDTGLITFYKNAEVIIKGEGGPTETIFKLLDNMTNNRKFGEFFDIRAELNLFNAVAKSLSNLGVGDSFDKLYANISKSNKDDFLSSNLQDIIGNYGDLDFLDLVLGAGGKNGDWILANYPNILFDLVTTFTPKRSKDGFVDSGEYTRLIKALDTIDPNWRYIDVKEKTANLGFLASFNDHSRLAVIQTGERDLISALMVSGGYADVYNTIGELQVRYPNYPIIPPVGRTW